MPFATRVSSPGRYAELRENAIFGEQQKDSAGTLPPWTMKGERVFESSRKDLELTALKSANPEFAFLASK